MDALHIWLRAETKPNEQRRALTPDKCRLLVERGFQVTVEYSDQCAFKNEEFHCVPGVHMVPCGSWVGAPKDAYILGLKELPFCMDPISNRHIFFAHAYKYQTGWENLLLRFIKGGGSILDIEFMTDENGRRVVAEFSSMAGLGGMGLGILAWCHQQISPGKPVPAVKPYSSEAAFIDHIRIELKQVAKLKGVPEVCPRVIVIGALGRCGKGAIKMAHKVGIPESAIAKWDLDETKGGGPFKEILEYDILVNCILLMEEIPPFVTKDMLESEGRKLGVVVDVSCDPNSANNPLPFYDSATTFDKPCRRVKLNSNRPVDVCAIDHFPSVLHRESSERFANRMTPYLLNLPEDPVWVRTRQMFERKAEEAQNVLEK
ncbi:uncharacterized protein [Montipora capricornis]|uniref:uncharacterized protein isoform X1 n=1 Tax=Montipora capricornis TaxID=246305 RepID=UPI0035F116C4